jgi:DNA invertase Pin-like site-specific DNA recombinase
VLDLLRTAHGAPTNHKIVARRRGLNWRAEDGIAAAKAAGKFKGRKPTARAKSNDIRKLASDGVGKVEIARRLGVSERSVYRVLAEQTD